jgi:hypothetical protein
MGNARPGNLLKKYSQRALTSNTENPRVGSSILPLATILFNDLRQPIRLPFFVVCKFGVTPLL